MKRMMKNLEKDGEMVEGQKREMEDRLSGLGIMVYDVRLRNQKEQIRIRNDQK